MHSKNHRLNHDFQIEYFLVGACHTADQAYALLLDLKEDREMALNAAKTGNIKTKASIIRKESRLAEIYNKKNSIPDNFNGNNVNYSDYLNNKEKYESYEVEECKPDNESIEPVQGNLTSDEYAEELELEAELVEIKDMEKVNQKNISAAVNELNTINKLIEKLEPLRKYKDLPLEEAIEMTQREEWKYEILERATNSLMTSNMISNEDFRVMRLHPDFETEIYPLVNNMVQKLQDLRSVKSQEEIKQIEHELFSISKGNLKLENILEDKSKSKDTLKLVDDKSE